MRSEHTKTFTSISLISSNTQKARRSRSGWLRVRLKILRTSLSIFLIFLGFWLCGSIRELTLISMWWCKSLWKIVASTLLACRPTNLSTRLLSISMVTLAGHFQKKIWLKSLITTMVIRGVGTGRKFSQIWSKKCAKLTTSSLWIGSVVQVSKFTLWKIATRLPFRSGDISSKKNSSTKHWTPQTTHLLFTSGTIWAATESSHLGRKLSTFISPKSSVREFSQLAGMNFDFLSANKAHATVDPNHFHDCFEFSSSLKRFWFTTPTPTSTWYYEDFLFALIRFVNFIYFRRL